MTMLKSRWRLKGRELRLFCYLALVLAVAAWKFVPRPWHATLVIETPHHRIYSTATRPQTEATARALTFLYNAYSNRLGGLPGWREHPPLQLKLYKDRDEMRRINPGLGWAEAFYKPPYCRAYYADGEVNPYHWMLHESTHQLNREVAHLQPAQWLEEGLATYFSTGQITDHELTLGEVDLKTYPVWWLDSLATSSNLTENLHNGSVIPLRAIVTGQGGPGMSSSFNLYYLHWWTLTRFIFESEKHRGQVLPLLQRGGSLAAFEELIGPVDSVQTEWHEYVRQLKASLGEKERGYFRDRWEPRPFAPLERPVKKVKPPGRQTELMHPLWGRGAG